MGINLRKLKKTFFSKATARGIIAIIATLILWELCSRFGVPIVGMIPAPSSVIGSLAQQLKDPTYWQSWVFSYDRVLSGFIIAQVIGIPLGLIMGLNRHFRDLSFPTLEILRPIPPLAWVPIAVIFWPTPELSMIFVTFLGAFFTTVINILGGVKNIDIRYIRTAQSLGSSKTDILRRIVLPATLPSIFTGMTVGMGITWAVVVAAEMIASSPGLGSLTWRSYIAGNYPVIVIGMISIGIAGYISSAVIRVLGNRLTPWCKIL